MNDIETKKYKMEEYIERNRRWTDKAMSQLTFLNSLLLTLGLGFISLSYEKLKTVDLRFDFVNTDITLTCHVISFIIVGTSVFIGLSIAHNRAVNFRITRFINQTRLRVFESSESKLDASTTETYKASKRFWLQFKYSNSFPLLTTEDCENYKTLPKEKKEDFDATFRSLRVIGHNLGVSTWRRTNYQIGLFTVGLLFYFFGTLI